jgi:EmrB/QacA subfamily drug resistance transporter
MARSKAILWTVLIAQFIVVLDSTVVTVALPSINTSLGFTSQTELQWVINAYLLLFGGFLLFGGRAGDLFGRQRVLVIGLVLFGISSLVDGLAQNPGTLIVGRAAQGLGGALVSPAVLSIIIVTFEGVKERTKAIGAFSAVTASSGAFGMLFGGILTEWLDWRAVFLINVPITVGVLVAALRLIPNTRHAVEGQKNRVDLPGAITITGGLMLLVYGIVNAPDWGWSSGKLWAFLAAAAVVIVLFVIIETVSKQPLIRLSIFRHRTLAIANLAMFLMRGALFTMMFFPTLYLGEVKGFSAIEIGLGYLPFPVGMFVAGRLGQKIIARTGPKFTVWVGLFIEAVGLYLITFLDENTSYAAGVLPSMIVTSIGAGIAWGSIFLMASVGVKREESGLASGLINTSQQLGGGIGLAVLSSVAAAYTTHLVTDGAGAHEALTKGFDRGMLIATFIMLAAAVLAFVGLRSSDGRHREAPPAPKQPEQQLTEDDVPVIPLEPALGD